ncbi:MAG: prepilin-type N-terminal cleavage/methylation domain-containing protein [Isosphaeraceae bacterium]
MRRTDRTRRHEARPLAGFTLVELLVVIVIIGIIVALILTAALDGVRRAEERATQALIAKLESGMTDRIDALMNLRVDANDAHAYLATVYNSTTGPLPSLSRAQTIARFDQYRAELPDVFLVQGNVNYPLNFISRPYNGGGSGTPVSTSAVPYALHLLPIGVGIRNDLSIPSFGANPPGGVSATNLETVPPSTGIFGAAYTASGGLYKSLAEAALRQNQAANGGAITLAVNPVANAGYDGTDNNGNGFIDELAEFDASGSTTGGSGTLSGAMLGLLRNHTHKTARSEVLYALLVNGQGPLGSIFTPDDFNDSEVKDTDGDGLPEFVDAWGEPLQFYRWPVFYVSEVQRGPGGYSTFGSRDINPLDPNKALLDPSWWSDTVNLAASNPWGARSPLSGGAATFQNFFMPLTDPNTDPSLGASSVVPWDRSSPGTPFYSRRAFYSRFLILSGGPDKTPGVPVLDANYFRNSSLTDYGYYPSDPDPNGPTGGVSGLPAR